MKAKLPSRERELGAARLEVEKAEAEQRAREEALERAEAVLAETERAFERTADDERGRRVIEARSARDLAALLVQDRKKRTAGAHAALEAVERKYALADLEEAKRAASHAVFVEACGELFDELDRLDIEAARIVEQLAERVEAQRDACRHVAALAARLGVGVAPAEHDALTLGDARTLNGVALHFARKERDAEHDANGWLDAPEGPPHWSDQKGVETWNWAVAALFPSVESDDAA